MSLNLSHIVGEKSISEIMNCIVFRYGPVLGNILFLDNCDP